VSTNWNNEATALAKQLKAMKGVKWPEVAEKISALDPEDPITAQSLTNAINRGNYNIRLLIRIATVLNVDITFKEKG